MQRDYFLDAEQALELGLVDKVLTSRDEQDEAISKLKDDTADRINDENSGDGGEDGQPPSPAESASPS
jgi:enoyl-CoA hydratase/carnithine racemase